MALQGFSPLLCFTVPDEGQPGSAVQPSAPKDRAMRQQLEKCLHEARARAGQESQEPLLQGRMALVGLAGLTLLRCVAWYQGNVVGDAVFGMHFLSSTADVICLVSSLPLFSTGTRGHCVQVGCIGPVMTLVFAMTVVDLGALCAFLFVASPRPLAPGERSVLDVLEACVGVWEFALAASVCLEVSLCLSAWRIYKELRLVGLYPPGTRPAGAGGRIEEVSFMEICCEMEDVRLLKERLQLVSEKCQCNGGAQLGQDDPESPAASPSSRGTASEVVPPR